jgi:hypothetical protein
MKRFKYEILDDGEIEISINGRDKRDSDGKFLDLFIQKKFRIESTELMILRRAILDASFEWSARFHKSLDE